MNGQANMKRISGLLAVATLVALVVHIAVLGIFNQHVLKVHGNDSSAASYMEIDTRKDSTSTWLKRDYDLAGQTVDLTGATIDGTLHNTSGDTMADWALRINIVGDCLINQAWNGEVEIHQNVGTAEEAVQRMNLQDYNLEDVQLAHYYDGDLLIPLHAGDFVLYFPSQKFKEAPLAGNDSAKIGVIFYYLDSIDLSDYDLEFRYERTFTQGPTFLLFGFLFVLCAVCVLVWLIGERAYKRAQTEMELRKAGLSSLSDMYAAIYIIDIASDEMTPVSVDEHTQRKRLWSVGARKFLGKIAADAAESYRDVVAEFTNVDTLAARLQERNSIVCEFVSGTYGWSSMRFFALDRIKGEPIEKIVCTVQDINDEKLELDRVEQRVSAAESESRAKSTFLANMSQEAQGPIREMLDLNDRILAESGEERIRAYAAELRSAGDSLVAFVDSILDYSELEAGRLRLAPANYALNQLLADTVGDVGPLMKRRGLTFELEASPDIPNGLHGDGVRLKQAIDGLLVAGANALDSGSVKLSLFGKTGPGTVHLLVSVRAAQGDATEPANAQPSDRHAWPGIDAKGAGKGVGMGLVVGLLSLMDSELKLVQSNGAWYECYFEVDQAVVDATPVGAIEGRVQW